MEQIILTEQDLTAIRDGIYQIASTKESGQTFEYCYDKGDYCVIMDLTYTYDIKEVRGGSFEYFNGVIEYERCTEIINETYTIESLSAFCEETELEVPEDLEKRLINLLNTK